MSICKLVVKIEFYNSFKNKRENIDVIFFLLSFVQFTVKQFPIKQLLLFKHTHTLRIRSLSNFDFQIINFQIHEIFFFITLDWLDYSFTVTLYFPEMEFFAINYCETTNMEFCFVQRASYKNDKHLQ